MSEAANSGSSFQDPKPAEVSHRPRVRPGGLTIVCVLAIVLGAFTLLGALMTMANLVFMEQIQQFATSLQQQGAANENEDMKRINKMNRELQTRLGDVNKKYRIPMMALNLLYLVLAGLLLFGGGKGLGLHSVALPVLTIACIGGLVLEVADAGMVGLTMSKNFGVIDSMRAEAGESSPIAALLLVTRWSLVLSTVMAGLMVLGKALYYLLSLRYLRKDSIRELFAATGAYEV